MRRIDTGQSTCSLGLTAAFIIAALALMGAQTYRTIGIEWLVVSLVAATINTNGYVQGFRLGAAALRLTVFALLAEAPATSGQMVGAVMLCLDIGAGIYISAVALISISSFWSQAPGCSSSEPQPAPVLRFCVTGIPAKAWQRSRARPSARSPRKASNAASSGSSQREGRCPDGVLRRHDGEQFLSPPTEDQRGKATVLAVLPCY